MTSYIGSDPCNDDYGDKCNSGGANDVEHSVYDIHHGRVHYDGGYADYFMIITMVVI